MASGSFTAADFRVFEIDGFKARMEAIRTRIRPKLEVLGKALVSDVSHATGAEAFVHVARHARRTVNPPDDTWVALGPDQRGYKKHGHFKVAISRHCVRFLFEVGPDHADKERWAAAWRKSAPRLGPVFRRVGGLVWFKDEHDEDPAAQLEDLDAEALVHLADELTRTRDGQMVVGRVVPLAEAARLTEAQHRAAAVTTFRTLAPLYRLSRT